LRGLRDAISPLALTPPQEAFQTRLIFFSRLEDTLQKSIKLCAQTPLRRLPLQGKWVVSCHLPAWPVSKPFQAHPVLVSVLLCRLNLYDLAPIGLFAAIPPIHNLRVWLFALPAMPFVWRYTVVPHLTTPKPRLGFVPPTPCIAHSFVPSCCGGTVMFPCIPKPRTREACRFCEASAIQDFHYGRQVGAVDTLFLILIALQRPYNGQSTWWRCALLNQFYFIYRYSAVYLSTLAKSVSKTRHFRWTTMAVYGLYPPPKACLPVYFSQKRKQNKAFSVDDYGCLRPVSSTESLSTFCALTGFHQRQTAGPGSS
jgi:hypothetical protein